MNQVKFVLNKMPFIDAITQMPKNAKFLKDLISDRREMEQASEVVLNE